MQPNPDNLVALGRRERNLGDLEAARACYEQAAVLYRRGNPLRFAHTIRHVADIFVEEGNTNAAEPLYADALAIYRTDPNTHPLDLANAIRGLAVLKQQTGALAEARTLWTEAHNLYTTLGIDEAIVETRRRIDTLNDQQDQ